MMSSPLVEIPDELAAIANRLKANTNVTALCPPERITMRIDDDDAAYLGQTGNFLILLADAGSGVRGSHPDVPLLGFRVDVRCYGSSGYEAKRLWRRVYAALIPVDRQSGFTDAQTGAIITSLSLEGGPNPLVEPEGWNCRFGSFVGTMYEQAAA